MSALPVPPSHDVVDARLRDCDGDVLADVLLLGGGMSSTVVAELKTGQPVVVLLNLTPTGRIVAVGFDITRARRIAEQLLSRADEAEAGRRG